MKLLCRICFVSLLSVLPVFSQDYSSPNADRESDAPFLFSAGLSFTPYRQADGGHFTYRKTREIIAIAPKNDVVLKREKRWRVSSRILRGLSLVSLGAAIASYYDDSPKSSDSFAGGLTAFFTFGIAGGFSEAIANSKLQEGVDNYNFYITRRPCD